MLYKVVLILAAQLGSQRLSGSLENQGVYMYTRDGALPFESLASEPRCLTRVFSLKFL